METGIQSNQAGNAIASPSAQPASDPNDSRVDKRAGTGAMDEVKSRIDCATPKKKATLADTSPPGSNQYENSFINGSEQSRTAVQLTLPAL